jgi:hypothetical protein
VKEPCGLLFQVAHLLKVGTKVRKEKAVSGLEARSHQVARLGRGTSGGLSSLKEVDEPLVHAGEITFQKAWRGRKGLRHKGH